MTKFATICPRPPKEEGVNGYDAVLRAVRGSRESHGLFVLLTIHNLELLHPPAPIRFGHVKVAFGVERQSMPVREIG